MKVLLDGLLPRLVPGLQFLCVPHEGKQASKISRRAFRESSVPGANRECSSWYCATRMVETAVS